MSPWRLLLTRLADESAALAAELATAGVHGVALPVIDIQPLEETPVQRAQMLELDRYAAVIVISKPAARLGLERLDRYWPQPPLQRWFAVGRATAAVLEAYGLDVDIPEREDSEGLLLHPAWQTVFAAPNPHVLILRGAGGREHLAQALQGRGAQVDYLELYERRQPAYPPHRLAEILEAERLNAVMVSSGQGLEHLRTLAGADWSRLCRLTALVPSTRVAEMATASGFAHVIVCAGAGNDALMAALEQHEPNS